MPRAGDTAIERLLRTRVVPVQFRELFDLRSRNGHRMFKYEPRHVFTARKSSEGAKKRCSSFDRGEATHLRRSGHPSQILFLPFPGAGPSILCGSERCSLPSPGELPLRHIAFLIGVHQMHRDLIALAVDLFLAWPVKMELLELVSLATPL